MVQYSLGRSPLTVGLSQYETLKPALSVWGGMPVIGSVGIDPLFAGWCGSVKQNGHPIEHPCDHHRHGLGNAKQAREARAGERTGMNASGEWATCVGTGWKCHDQGW